MVVERVFNQAPWGARLLAYACNNAITAYMCALRAQSARRPWSVDALLYDSYMLPVCSKH